MLNKNIIREIVFDFQERELPEFIRRDINFDCPPNKIRTIIGARRVGKTFSFYQIISDLLQQGTKRTEILFINFEDERLIPMEISDLTSIFDTYYEIFPQNKNKVVHIFFDEIQNVPQWEIFIRRIHESEKVRINLTGSSSKLLSGEIATQLRGRTYSFEVYPFNFKEFLSYNKISKTSFSSKNRSFLVNAFNQYMLIGGYPEILGVPEPIRIKILQDYFNLVLYKDLIERYDIRNHSLMKYFLKFILSNNANPFSVNKVFGDIKSQGYKVSKDTLHNYLGYLTDAFFINLVPIFSDSIRKQQINYRKIYTLDHGLVTSMVKTFSYNTGRLLETIVYNHLQQKYGRDQIFYYRTQTNQEIDFLISERGQVLLLYQITESLEGDKTKKREVSALLQAMSELNLDLSFIITSNERNTITENSQTIEILPFWEWILMFLGNL